MLAIVIALLGQDPVVDREARLHRYVDRPAMSEQWKLDLASSVGGGRLVYLGAEHSRDPQNPQFDTLRAAFAEARLTVAFFEGPDRGTGDGSAETIRTRGESGYLRWLAASSGVRTESLEPNAVDQFISLSATLPADQVELFFVLRETARLRDREGLTGSALDESVARLLSRLADLTAPSGVELPFTDLEGLGASYGRYFPSGPDWREAPETWFDPAGDDAETGGVFMARINAASSEFRNVAMYRRLARSVRGGDQVIAVVGRDHVPMQADALRCALVAQ